MSDLKGLPPEEEGRADVMHVEQERAAHELEGVGDPEQDHTAWNSGIIWAILSQIIILKQIIHQGSI